MPAKVYRDFDAFAASVRGVDCKMMLRNAKFHLWSSSSADVGGIDLQIGRLGSGNIVEGQSRQNGYMIYCPLSSQTEYTANGIVLEENSFAILEPGCEFCISTKVEHDWCAAFIPTQMLSATNLKGTASSCYVTQGSDANANAKSFRTLIRQLINIAEANTDFESSPAAQNAVSEVLNLCTPILGAKQATNSIQNGRPKYSRMEIIQRALRIIDQTSEGDLNVRDLAEAADVSERTLRTAFNEYFGIGPVRYLQLEKLHRVHRILKTSNPHELTVSQVLIEHGEWAFSRFASRYKKLFGELPSETLRSRADHKVTKS